MADFFFGWCRAWGWGGGWRNRAEITVLTSQSVRASEDETSDRLRRCRRCQKHTQKKGKHIFTLLRAELADFRGFTGLSVPYCSSHFSIFGDLVKCLLLWSNTLWKCSSSSMVCFMWLSLVGDQWHDLCPVKSLWYSFCHFAFFWV